MSVFVLPRPLGKLRIESILDYYDGPRLLLARSRTETRYLGIWVESVTQGERWLYVAVSTDRAADILAGRVALRDAFLDSEDGVVFDTLVGDSESSSSLRTVFPDDLHPDDLPPPDDVLEVLEASEAAKSVPTLAPHHLPVSRTRLVKRIHISHADRARSAVGLEPISEVWSAWTECYRTSLRANGVNSWPNSPAVAAAVGSLAIDVAVPNREAQVRALIDWSEFLTKWTGERSLQKQLGIDSAACRVLMRTIRSRELTLTITLFHADSRSEITSFVITPTSAAAVLETLDSTLPVLSTDRIPQADSIDRMVKLLEAVAIDQPITPRMIDVSTPRQVAYYKQAARILQLWDDNEGLKPAGRRLLAAADDAARRIIVRTQFENTDCGWAWTRWSGRDSLGDVESDSAANFLIDVVPGLADSTARRRGRTLSSWHRHLFPAAHSS